MQCYRTVDRGIHIDYVSGGFGVLLLHVRRYLRTRVLTVYKGGDMGTGFSGMGMNTTSGLESL